MKKVLLFLRDIVEVYIPVMAFTIMFVTFIIQIFSRYILSNPLTWAQEVTVVCFIWTVILGACYTMRDRGHVKFTMIYDALSPKMAAVTRLLGNLIIVVTFLAIVIPSLQFAQFMDFQATAVFKIRLSYVFLPFAYFVCSIIGYTLTEVLEDIKMIGNKKTIEIDDKGGVNP